MKLSFILSLATVSATVTNYLWDEASTYGDVVFEYSGSGSALASYALGGNSLISQPRSGITGYFLQDGPGSTRAPTNSSGAVTNTYSYTAFGELFNLSGTTVNPYLYTGQQFDSLTGLYDLRARYYNPALGRFLSQDTYPVNFNNPVELNRYVYTGNDPINRADPSGDMFIEYAINLAETTVVYAGIGEMFGVVSAALCGGNLLEGAKTGFWLGAGFGAGSVIASGVTSVAGLGLGAYGAGTSFYDMYKSGVNVCNLVNALGSVALYTAGVTGLIGTVDSYLNSSSSSLGGHGAYSEVLPRTIPDELGQLNIEQTLKTSLLARETGESISITGRWSDTPAETAWRAEAVARMNELISQGVPKEQAVIQAAREFSINPSQVKISLFQEEVDAYIPKDIWDNLSKTKQNQITARLKEIFDVPTVDWYQILEPKPGWPDPATTTPPGSIVFYPEGTIIHIPFAK